MFKFFAAILMLQLSIFLCVLCSLSDSIFEIDTYVNTRTVHKSTEAPFVMMKNSMVLLTRNGKRRARPFRSRLKPTTTVPVTPIVEYASQLDSPWYAFIMILNTHRCGGSLISKKFVLTAAHCFDILQLQGKTIKDFTKLAFGEWIIDKDPDCSDDKDDEVCETSAEIPIDKHFIHEKYKPNENDYYDIAILKLKRPPRESIIVQSIQLPSADDCSFDFVRTDMNVAGFGEISVGKFANKKKKARFNILSIAECKAADRQRFNESVHFCGRVTKGSTTCKGDSGSGVTSTGNGNATLLGIVIYGAEECGSPKSSETPSGFLKVSCFLDWINEIITGIKIKPTTVKTTTTTNNAGVIDPENDNGEAPWSPMEQSNILN